MPAMKGDTSARARVGVSLAAGLCVGIVAALAGARYLAILAGWDGAAAVYLVWMWSSIWRLGPAETAEHALSEDPTRAGSDGLLLSASVISLAAVGGVLIRAGHAGTTTRDILIGVGIASVILAWGIVHTVFTLHYARHFYGDQPGGIDFNEPDPPRYSDFAYLAFTIGMTFQVSDTDIQSKEIRATALRHALLSYMFGAVIIATTINLIAGLTQ